jgi:hypothetical protein
VVSDAQCIRHNRQCRIYGCAGGEEAAVHYVQIVEIVSLAVDVQGRSLGVVAKADGAVLVRHPREWNLVANEQISSEKTLVTLVTMHMARNLLV